MAKKKKNAEQLPEGMSRRQAKLAARAAERAAFERDPRPFGELSFETDLIAVQAFVPSAKAKVQVAGIDRPVYLCTVLPGGAAAVVREDAEGEVALVALQQYKPSRNPNRDLAFALNWVKSAQVGETLESSHADGTEPKLVDVLDPKQDVVFEEFDNFNWWIPAGMQDNAEYKRAIEAANETVLPSAKVEAEISGTAWWINPGEKAHIRWVRPEHEDKVLHALARIAARGELKLGEESKFAGVFRTHGIVVPVWDLDPQRAPETYPADLKALDAKIVAELDNDAPLTADERRQLENIKSRQVTL
ncbi:DUF5926 family protein [Corynebacterium felinum]|uniref:DUF5926 domain-containing protein n=1 Tax=Corynebacterium felinum TaxID=131318 RepID=A0ABU2B643_9CORY|nr:MULTISPECIES: DUF5926 family protein [Corynebacterium]MDF5820802.1 DUF5926 family protein [Corynebacterium felinum]MDO4762749.1 DUF5926 family protein [Corynebacterium sp.]MDR7354082.1 hypothetical protein [Corynebacterium felinum]WJY96254.1 hypothetical protein CFELI_13375 [Corynebacterium felinum]